MKKLVLELKVVLQMETNRLIWMRKSSKIDILAQVSHVWISSPEGSIVASHSQTFYINFTDSPRHGSLILHLVFFSKCFWNSIKEMKFEVQPQSATINVILRNHYKWILVGLKILNTLIFNWLLVLWCIISGRSFKFVSCEHTNFTKVHYASKKWNTSLTKLICTVQSLESFLASCQVRTWTGCHSIRGGEAQRQTTI